MTMQSMAVFYFPKCEKNMHQTKGNGNFYFQIYVKCQKVYFYGVIFHGIFLVRLTLFMSFSSNQILAHPHEILKKGQIIAPEKIRTCCHRIFTRDYIAT